MTDFAKELGGLDDEIQISEAKVLDADNNTHLDKFADIQVETAHKFPRNLKNALKNILFMATEDIEMAENCFYSVVREDKIIRGASIRLAEIITACYGNIRASSRIVSNDGKFVTAQGMCWDLENNVAFSVEVKRKIVDKNGKIYSDDLQVIASNACNSIALRNAIFKVIPMAITSRVQTEIKKIIIGEDIETSRTKAVEYFIKLGVSEKNILALFRKKSIDELDTENIFDLRGIKTAIKEGDITLETAFSLPPKINTGISKAVSSLSKNIEFGDAEYEKTQNLFRNPVIDEPNTKKNKKQD